MENDGDHGGMDDRFAMVAAARSTLWLGIDASQWNPGQREKEGLGGWVGPMPISSLWGD
jgi:hypothetical protein